MSTNATALEARLKEAVNLLIRAPVLKVKQAMLAAGFNLDDASDKAMQMKVNRRLPNKNKKSLTVPKNVIDRN